MHWDHYQPTLKEILSDSITLAVMKADGVDPNQLETMLKQVARNVGAASSGGPGRWLRACVMSLFMLPAIPCPASAEVRPIDVLSDAVIDRPMADGQTADPPTEERT